MPDDPRMNELVYDAEDEYRPEPVPEPPPVAWLDGSFRIGIHTSIAGDIARSLDIAKKLGCNSLQIFSGSPRMWPRPSRAQIPAEDVARFLARRLELALGPVAIHANYLINLAAVDPVARVGTIQAFRDEISRAMQLGADFLIVHPGSARDGDIARATPVVAEAVRQASRGLKMGSLRILLENTAGMGNSIGSKFEELAAILKLTPEVNIGVCIDTAHLFETGYPIHTEDGLEKTVQELDRIIGLDRVFVVHVNDSKTPFASRVDRHEHIGKGMIGLQAFARIMQHPMLSPSRLPGRAFLLETPIDEPGDDRRNVAALWKLIGVVAQQAPDAEDGFSMLSVPKKLTAPKTKRTRTPLRPQKLRGKNRILKTSKTGRARPIKAQKKTKPKRRG